MTANSRERQQSRLFVPMSENIEAYRVKAIARVIYGNYFEFAIIFLIVLNAVALALLTFDSLPRSVLVVARVFDSSVVWVFVAEILIRIASYGRKPWMFFTNGWNVFDFLVIALIPLFAGATILLRLLRLLRIVRLLKFLPDFQMLTLSMTKIVKPLGSVALLIGFFLFFYAMAGVYLFGEQNPEKWGDLGLAFVTLTVLLTLENFPDSLQQGLESTPFSWLYFVSFMFLVVFTILNVLIGVVLNGMDEARAQTQGDRTQQNTELAEEDLVATITNRVRDGSLTPSTRKLLKKLLD
jgi:voltage-gated sodium channel